MKKEFNDQKDKRGAKLASGKGERKMSAICYKRGWSAKNTILVVEDVNDLNSRWTIYERIKTSEADSAEE